MQGDDAQGDTLKSRNHETLAVPARTIEMAELPRDIVEDSESTDNTIEIFNTTMTSEEDLLSPIKASHPVFEKSPDFMTEKEKRSQGDDDAREIHRALDKVDESEVIDTEDTFILHSPDDVSLKIQPFSLGEDSEAAAVGFNDFKSVIEGDRYTPPDPDGPLPDIPNSADVDFGNQDDNSDLFFANVSTPALALSPNQGYASHTLKSEADPMSLEIPDDLDDNDYDIDGEMDAEFAALEASFQKSMHIDPAAQTRSPLPSGGDLAKISKNQVSPNPYAPVQSGDRNSIPANPYAPASPFSAASSSQAQQQSSGLFVPASGHAFSPGTASTYTYTAAFPPAQEIPTKSNAPSFVSGKVAYTDPYALPETLVTKKRSRPQAQMIRSVASVPNLKATDHHRPPSVQRHASAALAQTHMNQPPSSYSNSASQSPFQPNTNAMSGTHDQQGSQQLQLGTVPVSNYNTNKYQAVDTRSQPYTSAPQLHHTQPRFPATQAPVADHQKYRSEQSSRAPLAHNTYAPSTYTNRNMDLRPQMLNEPAQSQYRSPATVYLPGEPHQQLQHPSTGRSESPYAPVETRNGFLHERQTSEISFRSEDSSTNRQEMIGQYLEDEKGAENKMFEDIYAVAEDDIHAAQTTQRSNISNARSNSTTEQMRPFSSPSLDSRTPTIAQGPLRSNINPHFQENAMFGQNIRRTPVEIPKTASQGVSNRYAQTEPSSSPKQNSTGLSEIMPATLAGFNGGPRRAPPLSRATSSHSYQAFGQIQVPGIQPHSTASTRPSDISQMPGQHPIASFGFGGKFLTTVPKTIPRFSSGAMTMQIAGPGSVNVRTAPVPSAEDVLKEFPGPLIQPRNNTKQKRLDALAWLSRRVLVDGVVENEEKLLLYKLLVLMLEHNGALDSLSVQQKLVELLCPEATRLDKNDMANFKVAASIAPVQDNTDNGFVVTTTTLTETAIGSLSEMLLRGDTDGALRFACDRHLWAHAMAIALKSQGNLQAVVQEFTDIDLNIASEAADNLKFLYRTFAGATTQASVSDPSRNWRKHLAMILNNKNSADDGAILSLAQALLAHGKVYASHICYLLCSTTRLGPIDDAKAAFALVGQQDAYDYGWTSDQSESVILSEIYEFSIVLAQPKFLGFPHLLAFKLQRAHTLADAGCVALAKKYCEAITNSLKALPKGTAYLNHILVEQLRDLTQRLDQNPAEEGLSWFGSKIARPKIDNLWGSLEGKFSKFVAGEAEDSLPRETATDRGPFGKLAQTPAISRVQSIADFRNKTSLHRNDIYGHSDAVDSYRSLQHPTTVDQGSYLNPASNASRSEHDLPGSQVMPTAPNTLEQYGHHMQGSATVPRKSPYGPIEAQYMPRQQQSYSNAGSTNYGQYSKPDSYQGSSGSTPTPQPNSINEVQAAQSPFSESASTPAKQVVDEVPSTSKTDNKASQEQSPKDDTGKANQEANEKKAGWLGGWFGGKKKEAAPKESDVKVHKAKLGEGMSLKYDEATKRWINPNGSMPEDTKASAPPPPMNRKLANPASQMGSTQAKIGEVNNVEQSSPHLAQSDNAVPPPVDTKSAAGLPAPAKKIISAGDDLASMLGAGPASRRAASGSAPPLGGSRAKRGKPAKKYVDVFQPGQ